MTTKIIEKCATTPVTRFVILSILFWRFVGASILDVVCQLVGHPVVVLRSGSWEVIALAAVFFGISPEVADLVRALKGDMK